MVRAIGCSVAGSAPGGKRAVSRRMGTGLVDLRESEIDSEARPTLGSPFAQAQMSDHRVDVAVVVQEFDVVLQAPSADQEVDGLTDADALCAEDTVVLGSAAGNLVTAEDGGLADGE